MTFLREETCPGCQRKIEIYEVEVIGGPKKGELIEWKKGCKCEDLEMAKKAEENQKKAITRKMQDMFNRHSLISRDLESATFEGFEPQNKSQDYAKRSCMKYVEIFNPNEPRNLLLYGDYGLGKSHLAKSITDGVMANGYSAIFISVPKLLRKIKSTYSNQSELNEDDIISHLEQVDLLVLDDLGAEKTSDWTSERIFDIIDSRQGMSTIYTTNYNLNDLQAKIGERNFSRVVNRDTTGLEFMGKNHRLSNFKGDE